MNTNIEASSPSAGDVSDQQLAHAAAPPPPTSGALPDLYELPADLWLVVIHSDYSACMVYEVREAAVSRAIYESEGRRHQVGLYKCSFSAVAVPVASNLVERAGATQA